MQQRLRVDGDMFDNAPRADADIYLYTDEKRCVFKNIRIRVDEALDNNHFLKKHMKCIDCHLSSGQIRKRETLHYCKGSFKNCKRSKCNCLESKQNIL